MAPLHAATLTVQRLNVPKHSFSIEFYRFLDLASSEKRTTSIESSITQSIMYQNSTWDVFTTLITHSVGMQSNHTLHQSENDNYSDMLWYAKTYL